MATVKRSPSAPPDGEIPDVIAGRYHLRDRIGEGGFGQVFDAWDAHNRRRVAVKLVRCESDDDRQRWDREVATLAGLQHPHIVRLENHGTDEASGYAYIAAELLKGRSLAQWLAPGRPLPVALCVEVALHIARALSVVHEARLVHRDVHVGNVVIEEHRHGIVAKLIDFGVVGGADGPGTLTRLDGLPRTPEFFPEHDPVMGSHTDVFALGVTLHTALAGMRPSLRALPAGLPAELVGLVNTLRDPDHTRRPPIGQVERALEAIAADLATSPVVVSARRRRTLMRALGWSGLACLLTVAGAVWYLRVPEATLELLDRPPQASVISNVAATFDGDRLAVLFNTTYEAKPYFRLETYAWPLAQRSARALTIPVRRRVELQSNAQSVKATNLGFVTTTVERSVEEGLVLRSHLLVTILSGDGVLRRTIEYAAHAYLGTPQAVRGRTRLAIFAGAAAYLFATADGLPEEGAAPVAEAEMPGGLSGGTSVCFDGEHFIIVFTDRVAHRGRAEIIGLSEDGRFSEPGYIGDPTEALVEDPSVVCDGDGALIALQGDTSVELFHAGSATSAPLALGRLPLEGGRMLRGLAVRAHDFALVTLRPDKSGELRAFAKDDLRPLRLASLRPISLDDPTCTVPIGQCWPGLFASPRGYSTVGELRGDGRIAVQTLELPASE